MNASWPWLALVMAGFVVVTQLLFGVRNEANPDGLPLLMVLLLNEFGLALVCFGGFFAARALRTGNAAVWKTVPALVLCAIFAFGFLWTLIRFYPETGLS